MKPINQTYGLLLLVLSMLQLVQAQKVRFGDKVVARQKQTTAVELGVETLIKTRQRGLYREMGTLEDELSDKRNALANIRQSPLVAATIAIIEFTDSKIRTVLLNGNLIGETPKKLRHGLRRYMGDLRKAADEIDAIRSDYDTLIASTLVSGGAGQNYKTFLKVLLRAMEVRSEVLKLETNIKNLGSINKILVPNIKQ